MILARLTGAFKAQNWFAVALEFIIVIAGVVIGFQVNAWAERQDDRARAALYLDRLIDDIEENERRFSDARDFQASVRDMGEQALDFAAHPDDISDPWRVIVAYFNAGQAGGTDMVTSTYSELLATGDLRLFNNVVLRGQLAGYHSQTALRRITDQLPAYRESVRGIIPINYQNHIWAHCYDATHARSQRLVDCASPEIFPTDDMDRLARRLIEDETLNNELRYWVSTQFAALAIHGAQIESSSVMLATLRTVRGRPE